MEAAAWRAVLLLSLAGMALGAYLTAASLVRADLAFCEPHPFLSCETVISSEYGTVLGLPVALLGVVGFGALFLLAYAALFSDPDRRRTLARATLLLATAGLAGGLYLTYLELAVIGALCPLCLASFLLDLPILALALRATVRPRAP